MRAGQVYFAIQNPIRDNDPVWLLYALSCTSGVDRISVRNEATWVYAWPGLAIDECETLARLLERDKKKRNYFEVCFGQNRPVIEFGEMEGEIIGCKMRVPYAGRDLFIVQGDAVFEYNNAIWVPDLAAMVADRKTRPASPKPF